MPGGADPPVRLAYRGLRARAAPPDSCTSNGRQWIAVPMPAAGGPRYTPWLRSATPCTHHYFGRSTASMTWITPLLAAMSVLVTRALLTVTPLFLAWILRLAPSSVLAEFSFTTSLAVT